MGRQAEVAPQGKSTGGISESYGRGWLIKPDSSLDAHLKMGDWNKMRIIAKDQIALQIHDGGGTKVRWRNIALRPL